MLSSQFPPCGWWPNFENAHHAVVFVIEDVTVEHPFSGKVIEPHDHADSLMLAHVHDILPAAIRFGYSVAIEYLELESMEVERVIHRHDVLDLPNFRGAEARPDIDAVHVHRLAVD